jgi:hypothetical protein
MKGIAQFVFDHIVKLEDGSMAYACYDTSRQVFKYKDENGNEISHKENLPEKRHRGDNITDDIITDDIDKEKEIGGKRRRKPHRKTKRKTIRKKTRRNKRRHTKKYK